MLFPFFWMILTSFKTRGQATAIPPMFFPPQWNLDNYKEVLRTLPFGSMYYNTIMLIFLRILCAVSFSSMAGFAFAKLQFPFKKGFFFIVLTQLMLPGQIFIIPQYEMISKLGQLNTLFALLFPGIVSALARFSCGNFT